MSDLELTGAQEGMLQGAEGEVVQRLMRLLVRLGQVFGARRLVPVSSVQVSGVSYKSIGEPGLAFLEDMAERGARVRVPTTLNPAGMDLVRWRELGFPEAFAARQQRIIAAFERMEIAPTVTCTPYLAGNRPARGDHIAWAESSAVSFANSALGARTNREGGPGALAAAVCGCTPCYGLHLDEGRRPTVVLDIQAPLRTRADFGALGNHVGRLVRDGIPYFTGISDACEDDLKALGAAMAASGAVALYHVEGITPEASEHEAGGLERLAVTTEHLSEARARLGHHGDPELLVFGCPHASLDEVRAVADLVRGRTLARRLWVCTSRAVREVADRAGLVADLEAAGAQVVADTCMVVAPIEQMGVGATAVDSGKAAAYLPGFCQQRVTFGDLEQLVREALS